MDSLKVYVSFPTFKVEYRGLVKFGELSTDGVDFYSQWISLDAKLSVHRSRILVADTDTE